MKKLKQLLLFFILSLISSSAISQDFWEQLYFPDTTKIRCIDVNDNGDIFVGVGGTNTIGGVYRSTDNAQTWDFVYNIDDFSFMSIDISPQGDIFVGSNRGWTKKLLKSSDNGDSWQELILPEYTVAENIIKILAVSTDTIYVSTINNNAMLLRTYDGGLTWDSLVGGNSHISEYISDILINDEGTIFLAYSGFVQDFGGVYFSEDNGNTWQFSGFYNYMITSLAENSNGDIFAGCWGGVAWDEWPGLYVLRNGETIWDTLIASPQIGDVAINSDGYIFFTSQWPLGVSRSMDNGETFELINEGLPPGYHNNIVFDNDEYLYATSGDNLSRSINTTVDIEEIKSKSDLYLFNLYPNPVTSKLTVAYKGGKLKTPTISIVNTEGKEVYKEDFKPDNYGEINIDISSFKNGVYVVVLNEGSRIIETEKILISN